MSMTLKKSLNNQPDISQLIHFNEKNLLKIARIKTIGELLCLSKWEDVECTEKVLNEDTTRAAIIIVDSIKNILFLDPEEIKDIDILDISSIISWKLTKKLDIESIAIGLFIENLSLKTMTLISKIESRQSKSKSITDSLTGLVNRAWIDAEIERQIDKKNDTNTDFSILLMDIDFFKQVNDTYGHLIWDEVLIVLAEILKNNCRKSDIVCRWGWEEFMIILPGTNIIDAANKANEIRKIIEETLSSSIDEIEWKITVSIWVTQVEGKESPQVESEESSYKVLMKKADIALYWCKADWRNKVFLQLYDPVNTCNITENSNKCNKCPHEENCI
jgi:diguanylate cyclase (GGDEF)-like protein